MAWQFGPLTETSEWLTEGSGLDVDAQMLGDKDIFTVAKHLGQDLKT